jgi:uncharacterized repeat protein (TIGR01451 family)
MEGRPSVKTENRNRRVGSSARWGPVGLVLLGLLMALLVAVPAQAATPASVVLLGTNPQYTDILVNKSGGGTVATAPGLFSLQVTPVGGAATTQPGFCVDTDHPIADNVAYDVSLQTAADDASLGSPGANSAAWLIQESGALIAAAGPNGSSAQALEAGALQAAVWVVLGEAVAGNPTNNAPLNARAAELVDLSAGKGPAGPVAISAVTPSTCAGGPGTGTALNLTGTPGATANLAVTAGTATLSASQVTFSAAGTASVTLTSGAVGTATVTVTSVGAELTRATRLPGAGSEPQETAFLTAKTYTAQVVVTFNNCGATIAPATPTTPTTPKPSIAQAPSLSVVKTSGKAVALAGSEVPYTIVVRNTSKVIARSVVAVDTLPSGMAYLRSSLRPVSVGKRIVWKLGNLSAGKSRTITVWLQAPTSISGSRTNLVEVSAQGTKTVRDTALTRFRRVEAQFQPPVTG